MMLCNIIIYTINIRVPKHMPCTNIKELYKYVGLLMNYMFFENNFASRM